MQKTLKPKKPPVTRFLIRIDRQGNPKLKVPYNPLLAERTDMLECDTMGNVIKTVEDPRKVLTSINIQGENYQVPVAVAEHIKFLENGGEIETDSEEEPNAEPEPPEKRDNRMRTGLRSEYYTMSTDKFDSWVRANLDRIKEQDEDEQLFIRAKWRRFYADTPFPGEESTA